MNTRSNECECELKDAVEEDDEASPQLTPDSVSAAFRSGADEGADGTEEECEEVEALLAEAEGVLTNGNFRTSEEGERDDKE